MESYRKKTARRSAQHNYRKKSKTSRNVRKGLKEPAGKAEILIMQCIVCCIVLGCALIIRFIDTPFTNNAQSNLKSAITSNVTREDIEDSAGGINSKLNSAKNTVMAFLGFEDKDENILPLNNNDEETVNVFSNQSGESEFRIDEDILEQLYSDSSVKKQEVPES